MNGDRLDYQASCAALARLGFLEPGECPPVPSERPRPDDPDPLGLSFFRTQVSRDLVNLTIPRTFFGRSEIIDASFAGCDLRESVLCWCDVEGVDFSRACLAGADLRASTFKRVTFTGCDLRGADLRHARFEDCDFAGGEMAGAMLGRFAKFRPRLSTLQKRSVRWSLGQGPQPPGG